MRTRLVSDPMASAMSIGHEHRPLPIDSARPLALATR